MRMNDGPLGDVLPLRPSMLFLLAVLAIFVLVGTTVSAEGPGDGDAGADLDTATEIDVGTWNGTIYRNETEEDVADYYVFPFSPGTVVEAELSLSDTSTTYLDVYYKVFDRDRAEVISLDFPRLGFPLPFAVLTNDEVADPVYYFAVAWEGSSLVEYRVNYTLTVQTSGTVQDDVASGTDAPRTQEDAYFLEMGEYNGSVGGIDLTWMEDTNVDGGDMYFISPEVGLFIKVELTITSASSIRDRILALTLENSTGGVIDFITVGEEGQKVSFRYFPANTSDLFLNITSNAVINNYTLNLFTQVPGADGDGRADAGEDPDHAMELDMPVMPGTIMRGHGAVDAVDYFELEFTSSEFVEIEVTLLSGTSSSAQVLFNVLDYTKAEVVNFTFSGLDEPRRFAALTNSEHMTLKYYFGITWEGPDEGPFEFRYELAFVLGPDQDDMASGKDVGNTTSKAPTVSLDTPVTGSVGGSSPQWEQDNNVDGSDVYEVLPTTGKFVIIKGSLDAFYAKRRVGFDVQVEDQSGKILLKPQSVFEVGDELEMRLYVDSGLPVYARVTSESEMCNYTIIVSLEDPPEVDLSIGNLSLTPDRPGPGTEATISVIVSSTTLINPATQVRVEMFAGGNQLDYADVIFDNSDQETVTFLWTVPSSDTDLRVEIDTLNAIPWESKGNNGETLRVKIGPDDTDNGNGNEGPALLLWVLMLVAIIIVVIVIGVAFVFLRGGHAEDEEPEDY